jgi:asparagine synthase (glutamine-hydrolysing)
MFLVAWGERAIELVDRDGTRAGATLERCGRLAVAGAEGAIDGGWRCWISGRLSNARELCERFGLPPTAPAPEAIARAYSRLGAEACGLLRGTFVVVALDRERDTAAVVRDQLGGRPLVYARVRDAALLAEHERAIVELLPSAPEPDRLALAQWIERGGVPVDRTLFASVRRVAPAHRVALSADGIAIEPYWLPRYQGVASGSRHEVAERLRIAAFAAVRRAAQAADRPAVLLSGGLDSSCVAAGLAAREPPSSPALALAGVFPAHPETDERELIEATARHTGLPVELIAFDERSSILAPALEHIDRWRLPPVTPNLFAWQPLMARARELGVDAMLDGEGGDELFGFAPLLIAEELRRGRLLAAWRLTTRIPGIGSEADARMRVRALRVYGTGRLLPAAVRRRRERARAARSPQSLLSKADELALAQLEADARPRLAGPMWWRGLAEGLTQPGETLGVSAHLRREAIDEAIDRRHPFLFDLDLLTVALRSPPRMLFEPRDRALLRDGLKGHIPEAVRARHEKSFFNSLLSAGLAVDGALLAAGPARADAPVRSFVRAERLQELLRAGPAPRDGRAARQLWHVGLADIWLRSLERPRYPLELLEEVVSGAGK